MLTYKSCCIYLSDGKLINPFDLQPGDLNPRTVYHALSLINRFTGNTFRAESVAEHSFYLYEVVPTFLKRAALLHDWTEVLFNDTPSPVKHHIPGYEDLEHGICKKIFEQFGVPFLLYEYLKEFDTRIRNDEAEYLFPLASQTPREGKWWSPEDRLGIAFMELDPYQWEGMCYKAHQHMWSDNLYTNAEKEFLNGLARSGN